MKNANKIPFSVVTTFVFASFANACHQQGNQSNVSSCAECTEYVLAHGKVAYTNPMGIDSGPKQEGSEATFTCNDGYELLGPNKMPCKDGEWSGNKPSCVVDKCHDIDCGGPSSCVNGLGNYTCKCAEGWSGGGVNQVCEKGYCKCTGNAGYWRSDALVVEGILRVGYDYGKTYGAHCAAHEVKDFNPGDPSTYWMNESWCYVSCDNSICPEKYARTQTYYLWRATVENVSLCYSYANCGGIDYFSNGRAKKCMDRGGYFHNHQCSCDLGLLCYKCGNGIVEDPHEECDDGNLANGDGCNSKCATEAAPPRAVPVDDVAVEVIVIIATIAVLMILLAIGLIFVFRAKEKIVTQRTTQHTTQSDPTIGKTIADTAAESPRTTTDAAISQRQLAPVLDTELPGAGGTFAPPPIPVRERTFANSNFKRFYVPSKAPIFQHDLLHSVNTVIKLYARRLNPTLDQETINQGVNEFMAKMQKDAFSDNDALEHNVNAVAEYLWTSAKKHKILNYMELCSILNAVIRDDIEEEIQAAVIVFRCINSGRVTRERALSIDEQSYPSDGETWRGGGFREEHRKFFRSIKGKKFRVPGFLATSNQQSVAAAFVHKCNTSNPVAMWRVKFDKRGKKKPQYRVQHMSLVSNTLVAGEYEYLFAPYSVFTLVSVKWSNKLTKPHQFTILAAPDNREEDENLPLAPWY